MSVQKQSIPLRIYRTFASVKTGVVFLILAVLLSIAGTLLAYAYPPGTVRILDAVGLTDVFHAWWFVVLLALISTSIICASLERWPNAWRFYARPYRRTEKHFRAALPNQAQFPIPDAAAGLKAAENAIHKLGWKAQRIVDEDGVSLFIERHRFAVMAVFVVHLSLLLILLGYSIDGVWGYEGFTQLSEGETTNVIDLGEGGKKTLPFSIRCTGAGQESYPDGTPKRYWSRLSIVRNEAVVKQKEIAVNDPLQYGGLALYQSGFGQTGKLDRARLFAIPAEGGEAKRIELALNTPARLDPQTTVTLVEFIPDFFIRDKQVFRRSNELRNPAFHLRVTSAGQEHDAWLFPAFENLSSGAQSLYRFALSEEDDALKMLNFTGLQVSYKPGQWGVWAGCLLLFAGLGVAFYMAHMRFWIVPVETLEGGHALWIGGAASKNRDRFERKFLQLTQAVRQELGLPAEAEESRETTMSV